MKNWLFVGEVRHRRLRPVVNAFRHAVFFLRFPVHRIGELENALFSVNRFNLLSFHFADHGDGGDPETWIRALLARAGVDDAGGEVWLQTFPRVLGHVFNPVSFWYCHRSDGRLRAIVAEVNNTFGERHCYLLESSAGEGDARPPIRTGEILSARKGFHVSPFFPVTGEYRFRFVPGTARTVARIDHFDVGGDLLHTSISGRAAPFGALAVLRAWLSHPLLTVGVVAHIHWQALRLWWRGVPFHRKPAPPINLVTHRVP